MYCVSVKDDRYNELQFYFENLDESKPLMEIALREGYLVTLKVAHEEEMLPV